MTIKQERWEHALYEAMRFVRRWNHWEGEQDVKDAAYMASAKCEICAKLSMRDRGN